MALVTCPCVFRLDRLLCLLSCVLSYVFFHMCALICVLSYVCSYMCDLLCVLSSVCSHLFAFTCVLSHVCSPMCALICLLPCALLCLLLCALICVSSSSSSPSLVSSPFAPPTLFVVSCRDKGCLLIFVVYCIE